MKVFVVGPLPPPVQGAAVITARVAELLEAEGHQVTKFSTSPVPGMGHHKGRTTAYLKALGKLLTTPDRSTVYLTLSGGLGLAYDIFLVLAARLRGFDILLQHHSFAYLTRRSLLMALIVSLAGRSQRHIANCNVMANALRKLYGAQLAIHITTNLAVFDFQGVKPVRPRDHMAVAGYLSNVSFEKGIDRFLDFLEEMRRRGSQVQGRIAGPFVDDAVRRHVESRIAQIGGIAYIGSVYGAQKDEFLDGLDLFVFPTRYPNEAQPTVIYEAVLCGLPVATTQRGCLSDMVDPSCDVLLDPSAADLEPLIQRVLGWESDPALYRQAVDQAGAHRAAFIELGKTDRAGFLQLIAQYDRGSR